MKTFKKLQLVKEMITQLVVCQITIIYKMIAFDLSKQQALDGDPKAIKQTNFTGTLSGKETILDFSQGTVKVLKFYFVLI